MCSMKLVYHIILIWVERFFFYHYTTNLDSYTCCDNFGNTTLKWKKQKIDEGAHTTELFKEKGWRAEGCKKQHVDFGALLHYIMYVNIWKSIRKRPKNRIITPFMNFNNRSTFIKRLLVTGWWKHTMALKAKAGSSSSQIWEGPISDKEKTVIYIHYIQKVFTEQEIDPNQVVSMNINTRNIDVCV